MLFFLMCHFARFQSKYHNQVADEFSSGKKPHLTMGEAEASLNPPEQFLRKHTGTGGNHIRAKSAKTHRECSDNMSWSAAIHISGEIHGPVQDDHTSKKDPVPRVTDHVYSAPKMNRNFIHWNALSQMRAAPPEKNEPKLVDAPNGNCQNLEKSGLKPKFALKKVGWLNIIDVKCEFQCCLGFWKGSKLPQSDEDGGCRGCPPLGG